jgi:hypothetical protein
MGGVSGASAGVDMQCLHNAEPGRQVKRGDGGAEKFCAGGTGGHIMRDD